MPYRTCDHLKEDGVYCSSPALRDQRYCYFHLNARARRVQAAQARLHNQPFRLQMPILDNHHSILAGIQQVLDALAGGHIRAREAAVYLYGLQQAASGLKSTPEWKGRRPEVTADEPLRALEIHGLHHQYALPFDVDLDAPPDVAAAQIDATVALTLDARPRQTQQLSLARVPARHDPLATCNHEVASATEGSALADDRNPAPVAEPQSPSVGKCEVQCTPPSPPLTLEDLPPTLEDLRKKALASSQPARATAPATAA